MMTGTMLIDTMKEFDGSLAAIVTARGVIQLVFILQYAQCFKHFARHQLLLLLCLKYLHELIRISANM